MEMELIKGQAVSTGFSEGPAFIFKSYQPKLSSQNSTQDEIPKFHAALKKAEQDLRRLQERAAVSGDKNAQEILEAHIGLLQDPEAIEQTEALIGQSHFSAERAYSQVIQGFKDFFAQMDDVYLKERIHDLQDISIRVLFYIENPTSKFPDLYLAEPSILVAEDVTPSQILAIDRKMILGLLTSHGGPTSHTSILARSLEIPAVVGAAGIQNIKSGQKLILNAVQGECAVDSTEEFKKSFYQQKAQFEKELTRYDLERGQKSETVDGRKVDLMANISGEKDLASFLKNDAEGVGLYRTEFLFLDRATAPSEEEQYQEYSKVFAGVKGRKVIVRTLDIGGDKAVDYLDLPVEENPFLGVRALRLCFQKPALFKTQLRAILRAAYGGELAIMFPMVAQVEEIVLARQFLKEVETELKTQGQKFAEKYQVGIMVEIPSVALLVDTLAPYVDFISIGTNDLLQYTTASDRLNPALKGVYEPFNPGFLRLMHLIISQAVQHKIHVGICGSLSHHNLLMPYFIGCGIEELSMTAQHILPTRARLRALKFSECKTLVAQVLKAATVEEIKSILRRDEKI